MRAGLLDEGLALLHDVRIARRGEDESDGDVVFRDRAEPELLGLAFEEGLGQLGENAGAVAGLGVGVERAAVGKGIQRLEREFDDPMLTASVGVGDKSNTTGVVLKFGPVQRVRDVRKCVHGFLQVAIRPIEAITSIGQPEKKRPISPRSKENLSPMQFPRAKPHASKLVKHPREPGC